MIVEDEAVAIGAIDSSKHDDDHLQESRPANGGHLRKIVLLRANFLKRGLTLA